MIYTLWGELLFSDKTLKITAVSFIAAVAAAFIIYDALSGERGEFTAKDFAMGTIVTQCVRSGNEKLAESVIGEIKRLESDVISWRMNTSAVARLNENGSVESGELSAYIKPCLELSEKSGGRFDITCAELTRLWGIGSDKARLPSDEEIDEALKKVDYTAVKVFADTITLESGQSVDMGAVGKGIACDGAYEILKKSNVRGAVVSVGGSVLLYGEKGKNETWSVGIRNPFSEEVNSQMGTLFLERGFISTSGSYERMFEYEGKKYHHILDAATGYPSENELSSVTVVADSGLMSDALSTVCFIVGYEKSLEILSEYNAQAVFIFNDRTVKVTPGLKDSFKLADAEFKEGF